VRNGCFEYGDAVEQVDDQTERGVVQREASAQPLQPGHLTNLVDCEGQ
jgi:hypothetical protein